MLVKKRLTRAPTSRDDGGGGAGTSFSASPYLTYVADGKEDGGKHVGGAQQEIHDHTKSGYQINIRSTKSIQKARATAEAALAKHDWWQKLR
jgi:hypothetical protein